MPNKFTALTAEQQLLPRLDVMVGDLALVEPQGVGERFKTSFIGWEPGRYIILRLPSRLELRDYLYAGKLVIVRYLSCAGDVSGFESEIQGVNYKPQHLFFINYPQKVEVFRLRKESRVDCFLPATLLIADDLHLPAHIVNISKSGCRIGLTREQLHGHTFNPDDMFLCEFLFLGQPPPPQGFLATVRTLTEDGDKLFLGVEFRQVSEDMRRQIETYVQDVTEYLGGSCAPRT